MEANRRPMNAIKVATLTACTVTIDLNSSALNVCSGDPGHCRPRPSRSSRPPPPMGPDVPHIDAIAG
jgi:hypothetical protein